jgi:phosphoribosylanthranilate isomerase
MTFIKFCGMTREEDVEAACRLGVDAIGFVMWPRSPRYVNAARVASLVKMMSPHVTPVGVFVSPSDDEIVTARESGIRVIQLHGVDAPTVRGADVWMGTSLERGLDHLPNDMTIVLDVHDPERHGGTGQTIDWTRAAAIAATRRVMLAGGLTAANVGPAIRQVKPFGVDVASGIENRPGLKSAPAMEAFVTAVREADQ